MAEKKKRNAGGKRANTIFYTALAVAIISIIIVGVQASRQNQEFLQKQAPYFQGQQMFSQKKYEQAVPLLAMAAKNYPDSFRTHWSYALSLAKTNQYDKALDEMLEAQRIRPALLNNSLFMLQMGELLYRMGDHQAALAYVENSKKYTKDDRFIKMADMLQQEITDSLKNAGGGKR